VTILDDLSTQKTAITTTSDGYIASTIAANAAALAEMQALDVALSDIAATITAERAKLAPAMAALIALNLAPDIPAA
jgi:hypothetical protein